MKIAEFALRYRLSQVDSSIAKRLYSQIEKTEQEWIEFLKPHFNFKELLDKTTNLVKDIEVKIEKEFKSKSYGKSSLPEVNTDVKIDSDQLSKQK